jgi:Tol biopolymer transport system component
LNKYFGPALILALLVSGGCQSPETPSPPSLRFVTAVEQVGPVAYRDPLGAVSPDGRWLAYTQDRIVEVIPASGGPVLRTGPGTHDLRKILWMGNSSSLAVLERTFDRGSQAWYTYDRSTGQREALWPSADGVFSELVWRANGGDQPAEVAGVIRGTPDSLVSIDPVSGGIIETLATGTRLTNPAWMPDGSVACLERSADVPELQMPCGTVAPDWARSVYGPVAFHEGHVFFAKTDDAGRLDIWRRSASGGPSVQLSFFERDAYAPQTTRNGQLYFKSQDYRVFIADAPAAGGLTRALTTFLSETPSWDWTGQHISFTWGDWRRQADDLLYPDITQHIGTIDLAGNLPASEPGRVVRESSSEDQSMHWSPNGKWIVFHSHLNGDDIWLVPADGSAPARQISEGGSETGWPRWSPDGRWIQYPSYRNLPGGGRRSDIFVIGVDQGTGQLTSPARPVPLTGFAFDAQQGEWLGGSNEILFEAADVANSKQLYRVSRQGGVPTLVHRFRSPQVFSGISASPDGKWAAFVAPGPDGYFQIHRVNAAGGLPQLITSDPSNKTQPAYSPDGSRVAFTVISYQVHFWEALLADNP